MPAPSIIGDRTVRRVSPVFFIAGILCFLFGFAGVSCNTDAARNTLKGLESIGGSTGGGNAATIDKCVTALAGINIAQYNGFNLVFGSSPSILSNPPKACPKDTTTALPGGGSLTNGDQANIGAQPLAIAAFAAVALGLIVAEFGFFGLLRNPFRGVLTTLLAVAALVALVIEQQHLQSAITTKISGVTAGAGSTFNIASYFNVNNEVGYYVALGVLGVAALYNAIAAFFTVSGPEADELPPPEMGLPPATGSGTAWPGLGSSGGGLGRRRRG
ncbi:MAG: hypothetical protein ACREN2_07560 [Candidatus Dormibacteria bacterium]